MNKLILGLVFLSLNALSDDSVFSDMQSIVDAHGSDIYNISVGMTENIVNRETELSDGRVVHDAGLNSEVTVIKIDGDNVYEYVKSTSFPLNTQMISVIKKKTQITLSRPPRTGLMENVRVEDNKLMVDIKIDKDEKGNLLNGLGLMEVNLKSPLLCEKKLSISIYPAPGLERRKLSVSTCSEKSLGGIKKLDLKSIQFCDRSDKDHLVSCVKKDMSFLLDDH